MKTSVKEILLISILFFLLTFLYLFPLGQGLILLPLDLLVSNYAPWHASGTILLKNPYMQDSIVQLFPWRHFVYEAITQGVIPLWNPYQNMGMPFMAGLKPMMFYPLNMLFLLNEVQAWNALLFSQIFLSMLFAYVLLRDFKLDILPAITSSFAFALSSLMIGLLQFGSDGHTLLWWPLIFFFAKRYIEKQDGTYILFFSVSLAVTFLAGHLQYIAYMLFLLAGFMLVYGKIHRVKLSTFSFLAIGMVLGGGLAALQLLPAVELFLLSHRGLLNPEQVREVFVRGLITPYQLSRLFAPDFFGNPVTRDLSIGYIETSGYFGIIPLFFCLYAIVFARKDAVVRFFSLAFIVSLLLSLQYIGELPYLLKIPVVTSGSADRVFFIALFSGFILSGFGLMSFVSEKTYKKKGISLLVFCILMALIFINGGLHHRVDRTLEQFIRNIKFPLYIFGLFSVGTTIYLYLRHKKVTWATSVFNLAVMCLVFLDLFRLGYRFLTFSNEKFLYPEVGVLTFLKNESLSGLGRTFGLLEPELDTYFTIYSIETYNPLYPLRTGLLLQALQGKKDEPISADNKYFLSLGGERTKRTLDFLGTYYIVAGKDDNPSFRYFGTNAFQGELHSIYQDETYTVFENSTAFPRFGLYYEAKKVKNDTETLAAIHQGSVDFRKTLLIEDDIPPLSVGTGSAVLTSTSLNSQSFDVETTSPALFYISDTFFPGWKSWVNGKETPIIRANYNFRAVLVPAGKSNVKFKYQPPSFRSGVGISILSMIVLTTILILHRNRTGVKKQLASKKVSRI